MKGMELCENYFNLCALPLLEREFGEDLKRMTIGLAGEGSECFGFDDEYSRDHDWGPGFCIWLDGDDFDALGPELQRLYESLPAGFDGFRARNTSVWGEGRVGVLETGQFYRRFLGAPDLPETLLGWLRLPENALATACNGKIFHDSDGRFTRIRSRLLESYPEDVRLKKLAARCMSAGREGQYNFARSLRRKEYYAADQAGMKFLEDALSIVFLLNRSYLPFYKWAHRAVRELPVLGRYSYDLILEFASANARSGKGELIESFSRRIIACLKDGGLSSSESDFLPDHGPKIQNRIRDKEMGRINVWAG
jgi:hypothetical protein